MQGFHVIKSHAINQQPKCQRKKKEEIEKKPFHAEIDEMNSLSRVQQ